MNPSKKYRGILLDFVATLRNSGPFQNLNQLVFVYKFAGVVQMFDCSSAVRCGQSSRSQVTQPMLNI